jgi:hypothetical protein
MRAENRPRVAYVIATLPLSLTMRTFALTARMAPHDEERKNNNILERDIADTWVFGI